jgi:hypothetical protein
VKEAQGANGINFHEPASGSRLPAHDDEVSRLRNELLALRAENEKLKQFKRTVAQLVGGMKTLQRQLSEV